MGIGRSSKRAVVSRKELNNTLVSSLFKFKTQEFASNNQEEAISVHDYSVCTVYKS